MDFEWDPDKRRRNLEKHGIDFIRARLVFDGQGEERYLAIGKVNDTVIAVAYTERGENIRIISARKARSYEREEYQKLHP